MTRLDELERKMLAAARQSMEPRAADRYRVQAGLVGTGEVPLQGWDDAPSLSLVREPQDSGAVLKQPSANPAPAGEAPAGHQALGGEVPLERSLLSEPKKAALLGWIAGGLMGFGLGIAVMYRPVMPGGVETQEAQTLATTQAQAYASSPNGSDTARLRVRSESSTVAPSDPDPLTAEATTQEPAEVDAVVEEVESTDQASTTRGLRRTASAPKTPPDESTGSTLALELSMLQRARRALNLGNGLLALGIVESLDERVPTGVLMEERSATRILSLCKLGRDRQVQQRSKQFLARYPRSMYAQRVRNGCDATQDTEQQ